MLGNLLMLERSRVVHSGTRTAATGGRVLLESCVARVLLSDAAAAECSCARDCLTTRHENTLYPPRTYLVVFFSISVRLIIYLSDLRTTYYSVACNTVVAACSPPFEQCVLSRS